MAKEKHSRPNLSAVTKLGGEDATGCPVCFGSGMEIVPGKGARLCSCQRTAVGSSLLERMRVPRRYVDCHLNSYKPQNISQIKAAKYASALMMEYPAVDRGLLLMGTTGVGKTHLAVSIIKGLAERGFGLYRSLGCSGCHDDRSTVHAPRLQGLLGRVVHLQDGTAVRADENYVRDSILLPKKDVVAGFDPVMPSFAGQVSEEDLQALVEWLRSTGDESAGGRR